MFIVSKKRLGFVGVQKQASENHQSSLSNHSVDSDSLMSDLGDTLVDKEATAFSSEGTPTSIGACIKKEIKQSCLGTSNDAVEGIDNQTPIIQT